MKKLLLIVTMMFCLVAVGQAASPPKEIIAEATYQAGDKDTPEQSENAALLKAKRDVLEQCGTLVTSSTTMKDFIVKDDTVTSLSAGVMEVKVLDKKRTQVGEGMSYYVKIRALVYPEKLEVALKQLQNGITPPKLVPTNQTRKKIITVDVEMGNERMNKLLLLGVHNEDMDTIQTAINGGANINIYENSWKRETPLSIAVQKRSIPIIDFLIAQGADANVVLDNEANGRYPNLLCKYSDCGEIITDKLLEAGADINFLDKYNENILFYLIRKQGIFTKTQVNLPYYISKGVNVNQINKDNKNILIQAFTVANPSKKTIVSLINDCNVNTKVVDNHGKQAIDYAIQGGYTDVVNILISK